MKKNYNLSDDCCNSNSNKSSSNILNPDEQEALDRYCKDIKPYYGMNLSQEEEYFLVSKAQQGNSDARQKLWNSLLWLVVDIALNFKKSYCSMDIMDIISTGYIGVGEAILSFNASKGNRLSTFATFCIKAQIINALSYDNLIHLPKDFYADSFRVRRYKETQELLGNFSVTDEDIIKNTNITAHRLQAINFYTPNIQYETMVTDPDSDKGDMVSQFSMMASSDLTIEEQIEKEETDVAVNQAMEMLPSQERKLLQSHVVEGVTLKDLAEQQGCKKAIYHQTDKAVKHLRENYSLCA